MTGMFYKWVQSSGFVDLKFSFRHCEACMFVILYFWVVTLACAHVYV